MVVIKLIDAATDEAPARWREKIAISTAGLACAIFLESGGYTVQPVAAPPSTAAEQTKRNKDGGRSQKLRLFNRGNARSGTFSIIGISQLPNPPMKAGITRKKIIRNAWAVIIVL